MISALGMEGVVSVERLGGCDRLGLVSGRMAGPTHCRQFPEGLVQCGRPVCLAHTDPARALFSVGGEGAEAHTLPRCQAYRGVVLSRGGRGQGPPW